jgi:hypothetical protein
MEKKNSSLLFIVPAVLRSRSPLFVFGAFHEESSITFDIFSGISNETNDIANIRTRSNASRFKHDAVLKKGPCGHRMVYITSIL